MKQYCCICLITDIGMKKFSDPEKIKFINNIFKQHGYKNIGNKTHYVCCICDALLTKSFNFVERALRAQQILHECMQKNNLVSLNNMLQDINRFQHNLNYSNLSIHKIDIGSMDDCEAIVYIKEERKTTDQNNKPYICNINKTISFENNNKDNADLCFELDNVTTPRKGRNDSSNELNAKRTDTSVKKEIVYKSEPYTVDIETYDPLNIIANDIDLKERDAQCNAVSFQTEKDSEEYICINKLDMYTLPYNTSSITNNKLEIKNQDTATLEADCNKICDINSLQSKTALRTTRRENKKYSIQNKEHTAILQFEHNIEITRINSLQPAKSLKTSRKRNKEAAIKNEQVTIPLEYDGIEIPVINTLETKTISKPGKKRRKRAITVDKPDQDRIKDEHNTAMLDATKKTKVKYNKRKTKHSKTLNDNIDDTFTSIDPGSIESDIVQKKGKKTKRKSENHSDKDYIPKMTNCTETDDSECGREYPTTCEDCDALISSIREHLYHYLSEHKNIKYPYGKSDLPYVCEICGTKINGVYHFKSHLLTHGEKNIHCQQCPKMFHTRVRMRVHVQRVHAPRKYVCDYCDKRFPDKGAVRLHIRTHTGERPFKCHICGAGFAHKGNRLLHLRQHETRPYPIQDNGENETSLEPERGITKRRTKSIFRRQ